MGFNPDGGFGLGHIHVDNRRVVHRNPVLPSVHEHGSGIVEEGFPLKPETFRSHQVVTVKDGDEPALAFRQPPNSSRGKLPVWVRERSGPIRESETQNP